MKNLFKTLLTLILLSMSFSLYAQQKPPYDRTRTNQVMADYGTWSRYFMGMPHGSSPYIPSWVPDTLRDGALYRDTTAHKTYVYNKFTAAWSELGSGGGGVTKGPATSTNYGVFMNTAGQLVEVPGMFTDSATFISFSKPVFMNQEVTFGGNVKYVATPSYFVGAHLTLDGAGNVKQDSTTYWGEPQVDSAILAHGGVNIYNADGSFTANRTATLNNHTLTFFDNQGANVFGMTMSKSSFTVGIGNTTTHSNGTFGMGSGAIQLGMQNTTLGLFNLITINGFGGITIQDQLSNTGLINYAHHTITSSLQYAEIQDVNDIAKAKADSVIYPIAFMGQSNMEGKADTTGSIKLTAADKAYKYVNGVISIANDPQGNPDTLHKGSMIPALLIKMHQLTGHSYLDIPIAVGGSSQVSAANTGKGTWDVSAGGNLTQYGIKVIDSALALARAQGYTIMPLTFVNLQGETDATAVQTGTITGLQYYNAHNTMIDTLHNHYGKNMAFDEILLGTRNALTGSSYAFDTIRNRQIQAAVSGHSTIVYSGFRYFKDWGLMNPNPFYSVLHASMKGYEYMGTQTGIGIVAGESNYITPVASAVVPSVIIPGAPALVTTPDDGFLEHYKGNYFATDGSTRSRFASMPQNGVLPGAIFFGGSGRGLTSDSTNFRYDAANAALHIGGTPYFSAHQNNAITAVGSNASIILENYGGASNFIGLSSSGTQISPTANLSGKSLGSFSTYSRISSTAFSANPVTKIQFVAQEDHSISNAPTDIEFYNAKYGSGTNSLSAYINSNGSLVVSSLLGILSPYQLISRGTPINPNAALFISSSGNSNIHGILSSDSTKFYNTSLTATKFILDATIPTEFNTTNNQTVTFGTGAFTVKALSTGIVHSSIAGLFSSSTIATGDIAANAITYAKIQAGTTNKLYGTGSGTAFAEISLGSNLSYSGTTLNWTAPTIGSLPGRTVVADVNYTQLATDYAITYTSLTAARSVTLVAIADKQTILVKDEAGTAATNNITVNAPSGKTIDGAATKIISTNNGFVKLYYQLSSGNYFTY